MAQQQKAPSQHAKDQAEPDAIPADQFAGFLKLIKPTPGELRYTAPP